jgi:5-methyltetrahydropteroyltriglutamate--homocysteine methyltransferase
MSNLPLFPTQEIGSLQKPVWRVKGLTGNVSDKDLEELKRWYSKLNMHNRVENVISIITKIKNEKYKDKLVALKQQLKEESQIFALRFLEEAGLDIIYDGEQTRVEMYEDPISDINGFKFLGLVRVFDVMKYKKAACIQEPSFKVPYHLQEFLFLKNKTEHELKVPITGAYTLAEWSYNEFYGRKNQLNDVFDLFGSEKIDRREIALAIAKNVIRPNIAALVENGAKWVQIDEPAATTYPDEVDLVVDTFNESVKGLNVKASIHMCFSDYKVFFPGILEMKNCYQYAWEFANADTTSLGTNNGARIGYKVLDLFKEYDVPGTIGLGVLNVHSDFIEPPELIRDRILYAAKILGEDKIYVNPDCGLRTRRLDVAFAKLKNMVAGAKLAREALK